MIKKAIIALPCMFFLMWSGKTLASAQNTDYYSTKDTVMVGNVIYDVKYSGPDPDGDFTYISLKNRQNSVLLNYPADRVSGENYSYRTGYPRAIMNSDELAAIASDVFTEQESAALNAVKDYLAITVALDPETYNVLEVDFWFCMFGNSSPFFGIPPKRFAMMEQKLKSSNSLVKWLSVSGYNPTYIRAQGYVF